MIIPLAAVLVCITLKYMEATFLDIELHRKNTLELCKTFTSKDLLYWTMKWKELKSGDKLFHFKTSAAFKQILESIAAFWKMLKTWKALLNYKRSI